MSEPLASPQDQAPDRKAQLLESFTALEAAPDAAPAETPDRPRGPDGKFAPATPAADAAPEPTPEPEEPLWTRAPASWKREYHEPWGTVDPKIREYVWQREQEMAAGVEPLKTKAQVADAFNKAVEPYLETIRGLGADPITAVASLMRTDQQLRTLPGDQKKALLAQLAQSYGVNLGDIDPSLVPNTDPRVFAMEQELNALRGQFNGLTESQRQEQDNKLLAEIAAFAPKAELFDDAKPVMIQLLQSGLASSLEDAYQKAIRMDQVLWDKAEQGRQAEADATKRAAADKAAKAAKAAAVSVRSSTPGAPPTPSAKDRRSLLSEQFDGLSERF